MKHCFIYHSPIYTLYTLPASISRKAGELFWNRNDWISIVNSMLFSSENRLGTVTPSYSDAPQQWVSKKLISTFCGNFLSDWWRTKNYSSCKVGQEQWEDKASSKQEYDLLLLLSERGLGNIIPATCTYCQCLDASHQIHSKTCCWNVHTETQ